MNARAPFITFEGGDGAGKSTHLRLFADRLRGRGYRVFATREPGGAPGAEAIRALLVSGPVDRWTALGEALMMYAARAEHLAAGINPARLRGEIVLCDRFSDSTMAYQSAAGGVAMETIETLERLVVGDDRPDLTIILDAPSDSLLSRAGGRGDLETRFERKGAAFQDRVRRGFLDIAARDPSRCRVVDATQPIDTVASAIDAAASRLIAVWPAPRD